MLLRVSIVWLALFVALGAITVLLWRGLGETLQRPGDVRGALIGSAAAGVVGGAFVGYTIYRLFTMDAGDASADALLRSSLVGLAAGVYIAVVTADVYALLARFAPSSRVFLPVSLLLGPVVAVAAYLAVLTTVGPPTGR